MSVFLGTSTLDATSITRHARRGQSMSLTFKMGEDDKTTIARFWACLVACVTKLPSSQAIDFECLRAKISCLSGICLGGLQPNKPYVSRTLPHGITRRSLATQAFIRLSSANVLTNLLAGSSYTTWHYKHKKVLFSLCYKRIITYLP